MKARLLDFCSLTTIVLMASCTRAISYSSDSTQALAGGPGEGAALMASIAVCEDEGRVYVCLGSKDDERSGRVRAYTLDLKPADEAGQASARAGLPAAYVFEGASGRPMIARRAAGTGGRVAYEILEPAEDGGLDRSRVIESPFAGGGQAIAFASAQRGGLAALFAAGEGGSPGLAIYARAAEGGGRAAQAQLELSSLGDALPESARTGFEATSLCWDDGLAYVGIDASEDSGDGVLALDARLENPRFLSGGEAFADPRALAMDGADHLFIANGGSRSLSVYLGDRLWTSKTRTFALGGGPGGAAEPIALAPSGSGLYIAGADGAVARLETNIPKRSADDELYKSSSSPIIPRYSAAGDLSTWLLPFMIGALFALALHGFFVAITAKERIFLVLGLSTFLSALYLIVRSYYRFYIDAYTIDAYCVVQPLYIASLVFFYRDYLSLRSRNLRAAVLYTWIGQAIAAFAAYDALLMLMGASGLSRASRRAFDIITILAMAFLIITLASEMRRGSREARLSLALTAVFLLGGLFANGYVNEKLVAGTIFEDFAFQGYPLVIGLLIQALVFSFDLGDKLRVAGAGKRSAEAESELLREIDRQKTGFVMNVSHELRTPLSVIAGMAERVALGGESRPWADTAWAVGAIERNAKKLKKDIGNLLTLSRLDQRESGARGAVMDLGSFLAALKEEFEPLAASRGIALALEAERGLLVEAQTDLIEAALLNLISNALKYTPAGGRVEMRARAEPSERSVRVEVADTGIGIPEQARARVFERFYRAEREGPRRYEGTGIGLALVKEVAELHGGRVELRSEVGKGSVFSLVIPRAAGERKPEAEPRPLASRTEGYIAELSRPAERPEDRGPARQAKEGVVLIAEDDADLRALLAAVIGERFEAIAAADGAEALEKARGSPVDCVISDVMMPVMDGYGLLRSVRGDPRMAELPFLFLTARADGREKVAAIDEGAIDYIEKPFSALELVAKVSRLVAWRRQVTARTKDRIKDSIVGLLDSMDDGTEPPGRSGAYDYERLFEDKGLSAREREIARLILTGRSDKEIASSLGLSQSTVQNHNGNLYRKLGVSGRVELLGLRNG
jgi:signal transduction histidine kinase/DNA-binding NarL/FixJ family response regulator